MDEKKLSKATGRPIFENEDSMTAGPRGPVLLQDHILHEKLAHFNRERIPERVVHAKGTGAYGKLTITHDISRYTRAQLFGKVGNTCKALLRCSTVGGEKGSADTERDPRGFALKLYTQDGNWDIVGNNTPVFFIKDAKKFPDFIHTQKRDPHTNLKSATMVWDFWSYNPESLHQVMILFSDRGTPYSYRHMNGYGSHTFSMVNAQNERVWVKYHFKTKQGNRTFTGPEADEMRGKDPDWAQRDLVEAIHRKEYPQWSFEIQVMTEAQAKAFKWNPFDITKVWPHHEFPMIPVGILELNEIPANYFADVEQAAFAPSNVVDGVGLSPDKMLQGRILAYPDAHRYRLGANYEQLPVNRPVCPVHHHQRDGFMAGNGNGGENPNYYPNSFDGITADPRYKEPALPLYSDVADTWDRNANDDDHYTQPGELFRKVMTEQQRQNTINNLIGAMSGVTGPKREEILQRQLGHFKKMDAQLAQTLASGLGIVIK